MSNGNIRLVHSSAEYQSLIAREGERLVLVDFSAAWCGPCKAVYPQLVQMSLEYSNVTFAKVDIDECRDVAQSLGIRSVPMFHFYRRGAKIDEVRGADVSQLRTKLDALRGSALPSGGGRTLASYSASRSASGGGGTAAGGAAASTDPTEARRRAAEAAARRFAATAGDAPENVIDQEAGTTVSAALPPPDADDVVEPAAVLPARAGAGRGADAPVTQLFVEQLMEMGFSRGLATRSLQETNNVGIEAAIIWIEEHPDVEVADIPDPTPAPAAAAAAADGTEGGDAAASDASAAEAAAVPMVVEDSPETIRRKAEELQRWAAEKRQQREEQDAREALAREAQRRQEAKESSRLRKEYEAEQAKKEVLAAKRERDEDRAHRAKIQAQIEADKARRRQQAQGGSAAATAPAPTAVATPAAPPPVVRAQETYTECVLQIRNLDGSSSTATFLPTDTVQTVYDHTGIDRRSFVLMTTFPRKFYSTDADLRMTLLAADLVPRGVIIVTKR